MTLLNKVEGIPLYVQIRESLRKEIEDHVLTPGQKLPSEDELAGKYGVSRMTVRQGIIDLIDEGLLYRRHGVGTFVSQPQVARDHTGLTNFFESAQQKGIEASMQVLIADILPARLRVAKALNLNEGELAIRIKTLRLANGIPVTIHDAYVPYKLFPQLLQDDLEARHLWYYMELYGHRVKKAVQRLEAREADEELAQLLGIEVGAPVLYKERTVFSDDGTPVEFTYCYNRGDRYSLTVTLYR
ncbi:MAG: GntR family transcriptional regulator [Anaerolineales bacterium]|jgi:GntR family transcriptional regulator|nr:GntR family transcriptional regulator [Anaerolineales bacterium]